MHVQSVAGATSTNDAINVTELDWCRMRQLALRYAQRRIQPWRANARFFTQTVHNALELMTKCHIAAIDTNDDESADTRNLEEGDNEELPSICLHLSCGCQHHLLNTRWQ
jgi:hypothetical protein